MNSFSFGNKQKSLGAKSGEYDGWRSSSKPAFRTAVSAFEVVMTYEQVHCPDETTLCVTTFLVSSFSLLLDIFQSNQSSRFL